MWLVCSLLPFAYSCSNKTAATENLLSYFIGKQEEAVVEINKEVNLATWNTYIGKSRFDTLQQIYSGLLRKGSALCEFKSQTDRLFSDCSDYEFLHRLYHSGIIKDKLLKRQSKVLYFMYRDKKAGLDSLEMAKSQIMKLYFDVRQYDHYPKGWRNDEAVFSGYQRKIAMVHQQMHHFLNQCNQFAQSIGYANYFGYLLARHEIDENKHLDYINRIDSVTRHDYKKLKKGADDYLCRQFDKETDELSVFHYNYFFASLRNPSGWQSNYHDRHEFISSVTGYYKCFGMDVSNLIDPRWVSNDSCCLKQALACNIDSYHDVRFYYNGRYDFSGMLNCIHELAHGFCYSSISDSVPYFLREPGLILNESVAIFMENQIFRSQKARKAIGVTATSGAFIDEQVANPWLLFLIRNFLVMAEVEREMFLNPDQNLSALFWTKVEKYLFLEVSEEQKHDEWIKNAPLLMMDGSYQAYLYAVMLAAQYAHCQDRQPDFWTCFTNRYLSQGNSSSWQTHAGAFCKEGIDPSYLPHFYMPQAK
ncbi:hypothetical protein DMA11_00520 [Marinilabiliaceae bacterium JC017]|nr:hypothetical protein DMA11_00520 [Marinilabiliaceae bacterium JC017]